MAISFQQIESFRLKSFLIESDHVPTASSSAHKLTKCLQSVNIHRRSLEHKIHLFDSKLHNWNGGRNWIENNKNLSEKLHTAFFVPSARLVLSCINILRNLLIRQKQIDNNLCNKKLCYWWSLSWSIYFIHFGARWKSERRWCFALLWWCFQYVLSNQASKYRTEEEAKYCFLGNFIKQNS